MTRRWRVASLSVPVLAAVLLAVALLAPAGEPPRQVIRVRLPASGLVYGAHDAMVAVVEFGDIRCPACREFHSTVLPEVEERFVATRRVKFRYLQMDDAEPIPVVLTSAACLVPKLGLSGSLEWASAALEVGNVSEAIESSEVLQGAYRQAFTTCTDSVGLKIHDEIVAAYELGVALIPTLVVGVLGEQGCLVGWPMVGLMGVDSIAAYIEDAEEVLGGELPSDLGC